MSAPGSRTIVYTVDKALGHQGLQLVFHPGSKLEEATAKDQAALKPSEDAVGYAGQGSRQLK